MDNILFVDIETKNLSLFKDAFSKYYRVFVASTASEAFFCVKNIDIQVVIISGYHFGSETSLDAIKIISEENQDIVFIIMLYPCEMDLINHDIEGVDIFRLIKKPWKEDELIIDINNALEKYHFVKWNSQLLIGLERQNAELLKLKKKLEEENDYLRTEIKTSKNFENIISENEGFLNILNKIEQIADSDAPVLVTGETGTGKELIARAVHNLSERRNSAFICVNCAAIPETLFESEMFGHEKGAFTGAVSSRKGKFELAKDGTLFLDELGEVPLSVQPKLLRAIQDNTIERVGGQTTVRLNLRIICATNKNLRKEVEEGKFRSDLYFRINVFPVELPPLRKRVDDIPLLARYFIAKFSRKYNKKITKLQKKDMDRLTQYHWPGNIRELENVIERAVITANSNKIKITEVLPEEEEKPAQTLKLVEVEKKHILTILKKTSWKISGPGGAAELLDINRNTLVSRMKRLNISRQSAY